MGKREATINIRLSDSELALIKDKMNEYGTDNMSAYIRKIAIDGYVVKIDLPELKEMTKLLGSYGNNVNQIAKRINATGNMYEADLEEIHQQLNKLWMAAEQIIRQLAKIS